MNQNSPLASKKILIAASATVILTLLGIVVATFLPKNTNPYGDQISIVNYKDEIKNLPDDREQAITAALYNTVRLNSDVDKAAIGSASIRAESSTQEYKEKGETYQGTFIVDLENIRQSYLVTYSYSRNSASNAGYSVTITCLPEDKLIYENFSCIDTLQQEVGDTDPIIKFLPHTALTYEIKPDSTSGELILIVDLKIPEIDLSGNKASRQQTVTLYKNEVHSWIQSHGLDPNRYTISYNYSDSGILLRP